MVAEFELGWCEVAEGGMAALAIVEDLDVLEDGGPACSALARAPFDVAAGARIPGHAGHDDDPEGAIGVAVAVAIQAVALAPPRMRRRRD